MLTLMTFFLATSQFIIAGILDKVAASVGVSIPTAGQLITAYTLAMSLGPPVVMMAVAAEYDGKVIFWGIGFFALLGILAVAKTIPPQEAEHLSLSVSNWQ